MKSKYLGYIVMNGGAPCVIGDYGDGCAVLCVGGDAVTVFATRQQARRAIARTNAYAEEENLPWDRKHSILPVTAWKR